jgi:hypothetical protein
MTSGVSAGGPLLLRPSLLRLSFLRRSLRRPDAGSGRLQRGLTAGLNGLPGAACFLGLVVSSDDLLSGAMGAAREREGWMALADVYHAPLAHSRSAGLRYGMRE